MAGLTSLLCMKPLKPFTYCLSENKELKDLNFNNKNNNNNNNNKKNIDSY